MKCVVTGCAGFIGSHLCEFLLSQGYKVTGVDCFTDYYPRKIKENNLPRFVGNKNFTFVEKDIASNNLGKELENTDVVFHLAAQPGVRKSWTDFTAYVQNNIIATQRLLEACSGVKKFVFASSSSVYGNGPVPAVETQQTAPISPYGVTKVACENLCKAYAGKFGVVVLRFFTVYGPRQRPDMAIHKFIAAALNNEEITVYGTGEQKRDFTYVDDVVKGVANSVTAKGEFEIFNLGCGNSCTVNEVLRIIESMSGAELKIKNLAAAKGDVEFTLADISKARKQISYRPETSLRDGIMAQFEWLRAVS